MRGTVLLTLFGKYLFFVQHWKDSFLWCLGNRSPKCGCFPFWVKMNTEINLWHNRALLIALTHWVLWKSAWKGKNSTQHEWRRVCVPNKGWPHNKEQTQILLYFCAHFGAVSVGTTVPQDASINFGFPNRHLSERVPAELSVHPLGAGGRDVLRDREEESVLSVRVRRPGVVLVVRRWHCRHHRQQTVQPDRLHHGADARGS